MTTSVMTGKERLNKAFRCESVDRAPWVPFVGVHGGSLIGADAEAYLKDANLIVQGASKAIELYKPDGLPVVFDLQIEAEVLGCDLKWAKENPPAVVTHPLANGKALADLKVPGPDAGRIAVALDAARTLNERFPDVAFYGLITGPFTLALHMMGTDIFMKMFDEPEEVYELLAFCRDTALAMAKYYMDAGCKFIAVVDPMTSQIGPDQFAEFVTPYATPVFEAIREAGGFGSFFVCGHAQQNIVAMCECRPDNISVDENIPLDYVRDICVQRGISFGGNLQLTSVLLLGSEADSMKNALACLEIGGEEGFILAPGCDLPYATPPANLEAVTKLVLDPYQRDVVRAMATEEGPGLTLDMTEYGQQDKVIVDIITLDSEACAPCQYMVDAVQKVAPQFEGIVEWREHKIKYRESLVLMTSLMVRNVPTICIDGQITFVSRIPPRQELIEAIQNRINEKFRLKIQRRKSTLYVMGADEAECRPVKEVIDRAVQELGADVDVHLILDPHTIASYGVAPNQTPAVVQASYHLKSARTTPEVAAVKEWLKNM